MPGVRRAARLRRLRQECFFGKRTFIESAVAFDQRERQVIHHRDIEESLGQGLWNGDGFGRAVFRLSSYLGD